MKQFFYAMITLVIVAACGSGQPKPATKAATISDSSATNATESVMWKVVSYAGDLGDNKNSFYITNTFAIWGTYKSEASDNTDLKVKFLIDKVSFCIKLYEYGKKVVKKGDESCYKITIKPDVGEPLQLTAKNVSDRVFINESDAKKVMELFETGGKISFYMITDSKTAPASYAFLLDHPGGFMEVYKKL